MPRVRNGQTGSSRRRPLLGVVLVLTAVVLALAAVYVWQARSAYVHLTAAKERIPQLREQIVNGDPAADETAEAFAEDTGKARTAVAGPHWAVLAAVPWVGPNVEAVRTVTDAADDLAVDALPELLQAAEVMDPANLAPTNGRVPLAPIQAAAPHVGALQQEIAAADELLAEIETGDLHERLRAPVTDLVATMSDLRAQTTTAAKAARLLPPMLGAESPRHYLLMAQNNSELRALGGMPGAAILIRVDDGRVELVEQRTAGEAGVFAEPVTHLTDAERTLYGTQLGRYFSNVTSTPDFPRAAQLARTMWRRTTGVTVDGVASVDPYALQLLLRANGPVTLADGRTLDGRNAARILLNEVYKVLDPEAQDQFFATAAAAIFDKVMSGTDARATAAALAEATSHGRLMLWSADPAEQKALGSTSLGGTLQGSRGNTPVVGVYLHDQSRAKMDYYQYVDVEIRPACEPGDTVRLEVTLRSDLPRDITDMPPSVIGTKLPPGHIRTAVLVYAPDGGLVTEARTSQASNWVSTHRHAGLHVTSRVVDLRPGRPVRLHYELSVPDHPVGTVALRMTPGPTDRHYRTSALQCNG